jgi:hypothetical protein
MCKRMPSVEARRMLDLQDYHAARDTANGFPPPPIGPGAGTPAAVLQHMEKSLRRAEYYRQWRAKRKAQAAALAVK